MAAISACSDRSYVVYCDCMTLIVLLLVQEECSLDDWQQLALSSSVIDCLVFVRLHATQEMLLLKIKKHSLLVRREDTVSEIIT